MGLLQPSVPKIAADVGAHSPFSAVAPKPHTPSTTTSSHEGATGIASAVEENQPKEG
jgi:hypothetical protein